MKKTILGIVAALIIVPILFTGYVYLRATQTIDDNVKLLKRSVLDQLNDPDSAKVRAMELQSAQGSIRSRLKYIDAKFLWTKTPGEVWSMLTYQPALFTLCGEVNAKNGFGAYVGYRKFNAMDGTKPLAMIDREPGGLNEELCAIGSKGDMIVYKVPDKD